MAHQCPIIVQGGFRGPPFALLRWVITISRGADYRMGAVLTGVPAGNREGGRKFWGKKIRGGWLEFFLRLLSISHILLLVRDGHLGGRRWKTS